MKEKVLKLLNVLVEMQFIWIVKAKVISVPTGPYEQKLIRIILKCLDGIPGRQPR
jgi:hypothetical protein